MTALDTYLAGNQEGAWAQLVAHGAVIRDDPALRAGAVAVAVAAETMRRVRRAVERLREWLPALGWAFEEPDAVCAGRCSTGPGCPGQQDPALAPPPELLALAAALRGPDWSDTRTTAWRAGV